MDLSDINNELDINGLAESIKDSGVPAEKNDIMVVGVGGGGGNAVNHMFRQGVEQVTFVVINTDADAVRNSPVPNKVVIGNGKGAGNKPEVARMNAEEDIDKIYRIFDGSAKMAFITAGMGGGTGTGAAPVVARVAKERGLLTIGIVTIPFLFEGKKKILKALDGAEEMAKYVDALLIINNERIAEIYPDFSFLNAFGKADDTLSTAARSISEIITTNGYINLDFNDVDTTLRGGGTAIISTGYGEGEHRITKALEDALNSPLLKNRDIYGSKKLLLNLYIPDESEGNTMAISEVNELRSFVSSIDSEVDVIWGAAIDNSLGNKVKITLLAAGFDVTIREEEEEEFKKDPTPGPLDTHKTIRKPKTDEERIGGEYGEAAAELGTNYIILDPVQFDDETVMEILEKNPAYNRDKRTVESVRGRAAASRQAEPPADDSKPSAPGAEIRFM